MDVCELASGTITGVDVIAPVVDERSVTKLEDWPVLGVAVGFMSGL